ncbi:hypothetical protein D3C77_307780 [compost metagenome]
MHSLEEVVIEDLPSKPLERGILRWSNNSRYISYVKSDSDNKSAIIVVYDVSLSNKNEYVLLNIERDELILEAKISDDGQYALIVKYRNKQAFTDLVLGSLTGSDIASVFEQRLSGGGDNYDFMNDDQIVFIGQDSELILFDRRNESSTILLEQIDTFALSRDRKSIAYSKKWDTVYVAAVQGNRVMNMKPIYKGVIVFSCRMFWSADNKKLLIGGNEAYIEPSLRDWNKDAFLTPIPMESPFTTAMDMNNSPLIIEMK